MWPVGLPPDQMPDPNDPEYRLGVVLGLILVLLLALPVLWWTTASK